MLKVAIAVLAAITLAAPTSSLADAKPKTPPHAAPSSYAPGPHTNQHVYGSPIETHHAAAARSPRTPRTPTKHSKASPAHASHAAHHAATRGQQPAPAPAPT